MMYPLSLLMGRAGDLPFELYQLSGFNYFRGTEQQGLLYNMRE